MIGFQNDKISGRKNAATNCQNNVRSLIKNIENKFGCAFDKTAYTSSHEKPFSRTKQQGYKTSISSQKETIAIKQPNKNNCSTNNKIPNVPSPINGDLIVDEYTGDAKPSLSEDEFSEFIVLRRQPEISTEKANKDTKNIQVISKQ